MREQKEEPVQISPFYYDEQGYEFQCVFSDLVTDEVEGVDTPNVEAFLQALIYRYGLKQILSGLVDAVRETGTDIFKQAGKSVPQWEEVEDNLRNYLENLNEKDFLVPHGVEKTLKFLKR